MADPRPGLGRRILWIAAEIVVAIYIVLNSIVAPIFRPLMRFLSSLRLVKRIERGIAALPPYVILVFLVVPFGFAELTKAYAVILMAEDHVRTGMTMFISAYIVSILVCERTFHAGKDQLLTIGWFKVTFDWIMAIKERILGWFRGTTVWRFGTDLKDRVARSLRRIRVRIQATFAAGRPKRSFERN